MAGSHVVRLGCYQVGGNEQVLHAGAKALSAAANLFRLRWAVVRDGAAYYQPMLDDFQLPSADDQFTISFNPPLIGPFTVAPQKTIYLDTSEKIPRVELVKYEAGATYGVKISAPPSGLCPPSWPPDVTIQVPALVNLGTTLQSLIDALNTWQPSGGAVKYWTVMPQGASGFEFRLNANGLASSIPLSNALEEMSITNASNPPDVISLVPLNDPQARIRHDKKTVQSFLEGCQQVDTGAVVARATGRLLQIMKALLDKLEPRHPLLDQLERFSREFAAALYARMARETSLEDLLRDSRRAKAEEFSRWFEEESARHAQKDNWPIADQEAFARALAQAARVVIREIDEAQQGKSIVACALAMGTTSTNYSQKDSVQQNYTALAELCGIEWEVDATTLTNNPAPGKKYATVTAQIEWFRAGVSQGKWGMYPDPNRDCFNDASGPQTEPPCAKLVEDGVFVSQPDSAARQPVFKATAGDGHLTVAIDNASPQSFWPAFFVWLTNTSAPPDVGAIIAKYQPALSTVDTSQKILQSPMPGGVRSFGPIHWHQSFSPVETPTQFVWLCARSAAGGWLPPIPVNRDNKSAFGLKLPPSLSLAPNEVAMLSAAIPSPPSLGSNRDFHWQLARGKYTLTVDIDFRDMPPPDYYSRYGINEFQMLVFRRPGDLPKGLDKNSAFADRSAVPSDDLAYYRATAWFNTLLDAGWYPLPDISSYLNPAGTFLTLTYQSADGQPIGLTSGWKYIVVVVAKRPQNICYQVPRTAEETGQPDPSKPDPSYFASLTYKPDGTMLDPDMLPAWRYLASNSASGRAGSLAAPIKALRFEYSQPAITNEGYIPSQPLDEDETVPINPQPSLRQ